MYATHPTLVDQESYTFIKRGIDVYTAAWATKTRSNMDSRYIELNPAHPYQGKCSFLNEAQINVISKIGVGMSGTMPLQDVSNELVNNFDALYVSQVTPWLMNYARPFLARKKPVLFRTFGYPLGAWGEPSDYKTFYGSPTFYVVPTDPAEVEIGIFKGFPRVRQIMATIYRELIDSESKYENHAPYALTILQGSVAGEQLYIKQCKAIPLHIVNRGVRLTTNNELNKIFNSCTFYLESAIGLLRYAFFEAILHHKAALVLSNSDTYKFMVKTGFACNYDPRYKNFDDQTAIGFYTNHPEAVSQLLKDEETWLNRLMADAEMKWDALIGELCLNKV